MKRKTFKDLFENARKRDEYWIAYAKLEFTEHLRQLMKEKEETKAGLAKKLGKSPAYITKIFRGNANFTLETMVKLVRALGGRLRIEPVLEATKQARTEAKSWETYITDLIPPEKYRVYIHSIIERNLIDWINLEEMKNVCAIPTQLSTQLTPAIAREDKIERNFATA